MTARPKAARRFLDSVYFSAAFCAGALGVAIGNIHQGDALASFIWGCVFAASAPEAIDRVRKRRKELHKPAPSQVWTGPPFTMEMAPIVDRMKSGDITVADLGRVWCFLYGRYPEDDKPIQEVAEEVEAAMNAYSEPKEKP